MRPGHFLVAFWTIVIVAGSTVRSAEPSPEALPGKGLAQHDFLYTGEWDTRKPIATLFLINGGKVVWTYEIRVIGEDHRIVNNYIDGVEQGGFWITAGVPDSPLNAYFQAKNCVIAFNTVVDSRGPCVEVDAGFGGSRRTLRPMNITLANNLFSVPNNGSILKGTEGEGYKWTGNIAWPAGAEHGGIRMADPKLNRDGEGLCRPETGSAASGAADENVLATEFDIDGQPRKGRMDAGCDQASDAPATNRPLRTEDVGPEWMRKSTRGDAEKLFHNLGKNSETAYKDGSTSREDL